MPQSDITDTYITIHGRLRSTGLIVNHFAFSKATISCCVLLHRQKISQTPISQSMEDLDLVTSISQSMEDLSIGLMRLCHPPDGSTSPKYKLLCFITTKNFFCKEKNALAFNRDRCCHLVLYLRLIPFHCKPFRFQ